MTTEIDDLVKRLRSIVEAEDHLRGCGGRQYHCGNTYIDGLVCDYDKRKDAICIEAAGAILAMGARIAKLEGVLRSCLEDYGSVRFTDRHGMADRILRFTDGHGMADRFRRALGDKP